MDAVTGIVIGLTLRERMEAPAQENGRNWRREATAGRSSGARRSRGCGLTAGLFEGKTVGVICVRRMGGHGARARRYTRVMWGVSGGGAGGVGGEVEEKVAW